MFDTLRNAVAALKGAADAVDCGRLTGDAAASVVEMCVEAERISAAVRTLAASRVDESRIWQKEGFRTGAEWMAARSGMPLGQAIGVLETARRLEDLPLTKNAFRSGRLSEVQAREISDAAAADPREERSLLAAAQTETVKTLREECRRVKAAAVPDELARNEAIRRRRFLRTWNEADGAVRLDARLTPDAGAEVIAVIDVAKNRIFAEANGAGLRESSEAFAADALVELVARSGGETSGGPRALVRVLVDHRALVAGEARQGERCEIAGVGRIPVQTARALMNDSIIKAVVTNGVDIHSVVHVGRTVPERLRTALEVRDPVCVVPVCDKRNGLEIDHYRVPYADGGPARLDNLARLCRWHHYQKTHLGYRLSGEPGAWKWEKPDDLEGSLDDARPPPDP